MDMKATKIGGTGILTILGVVCLSTFLIAAFTWSSLTTAFKSPQEVKLGTPSINEWDDADFFEANKDYHITLTATYNFHSGTGFIYYLKIVAQAVEGSLEKGDFSISVSGLTTTFTESSAGLWISTAIPITSTNPDDDITVTITPTTNALDLGVVSFEISAQSSA